MREVVKTRTVATQERLGGCGFPYCQKFAVCSNCIQCAEHHAVTQLGGHCGFAQPKPIDSFDVPNAKTAEDVTMRITEDVAVPVSSRSVPRA